MAGVPVVLFFKIFLEWYSVITERFRKNITGFSEDMEDFMLEQLDYYNNKFHSFWTSFWRTCVDMWQNGVDISCKQMPIIEREYDKVKKQRRVEWLSSL